MSTTEGSPFPLHSLEFSRSETIPNRVFSTVCGGAVLILLYHRAFFFLSVSTVPSSISLSLLVSYLILAFMWISSQPFRMRPVRRREFPENVGLMLNGSDYSGVDIFFCTADPHREQPMSVVNTALSVVAYDYPADKILVYVLDDGGSDVTLLALMEASKFAGHFLPFCRENDVVERNPNVFFSSNQF